MLSRGRAWRRAVLAAALAALALVSVVRAEPPRSAGSSETAALQATLARIAARAPGRCAIAAWHFQPDGSGLRVAEVNADRPQVMASVYKLPIALKVLADVDAGRLALDREVMLRPTAFAPGWSPIARAHPRGVTLTVGALLDSMVIASDNTACDVLLDRVGGPRAVTAWLRAQGVTGIRVDRTERRIGADATAGPRAFARDPRDHGSARALADLLRRLWMGELLSEASRTHLWSAMARTATGPRRLRAGLPPQAKLLHKTGTGPGGGGVTTAVNDVGLVRLPGGGGLLAIAVLVENARGVEQAEDVIAEVARAVFEHWNAPD